MALANHLVAQYAKLVSKDVSIYLLTVAGPVHSFHQVVEMESSLLALRLYRVLDLSCLAEHIPWQLPLIELEGSDRQELRFRGENVRDILGSLAEVG